MANALTKSTQNLLSLLNKDKVPMEDQKGAAMEPSDPALGEESVATGTEVVSDAQAEAEQAGAEQAGAEQAGVENAASTEAVVNVQQGDTVGAQQDDAASHQNSEDLAAYFKALGLIDNAKARAYSTTLNAAASEAQPDTDEAETIINAPAASVVHGEDLHVAFPPAPADDDEVEVHAGTDLHDTGEWATASPEPVPEPGEVQESLLTPPSGTQPVTEEQALDFSLDEAGNEPQDFSATLDFLDNLAEEETGMLQGDAVASEEEPIQPVELEVEVVAGPEMLEPAPEEVSRMAEATGEESQPTDALGGGPISIEFDQDRSQNLRYSADTLQCSVDDLVVTAVDWYLDAILNAEEADVG